MGYPKKKPEWYAKGLRFACTQCGNCCTGPPGFVYFHMDELKEMAAYMKMLPQEFLQSYAHQVDGHWTLNETQTERGCDCVFLKQNGDGPAGCSIYPVRPTQCRTWPFWPDNLKNRRAWNAAAKRCPGMKAGGEGDEAKGKLVPIEKIRIQRDATPQ